MHVKVVSKREVEKGLIATLPNCSFQACYHQVHTSQLVEALGTQKMPDNRSGAGTLLQGCQGCQGLVQSGGFLGVNDRPHGQV